MATDATLSFGAALAAAAERLGGPLSEQQVQQFVDYRQLLLEWNQAMNLIADTGDHELLEKHFVDALVHAEALALDGGSVVDIGSGAGLPGLGLAIACPDTEVVLNESLQKRATFLGEVARRLELPNAVVAGDRVELLGRDPAHRERHDRVTARRVAELTILLEYGLPLLTIGGRAVFAKGERLAEELAAAEGVAERLGGGAPEVLEVPLPSGGRRRFVVVEKVTATPEAYPRAVGRPAKKPLRKES